MRKILTGIRAARSVTHLRVPNHKRVVLTSVEIEEDANKTLSRLHNDLGIPKKVLFSRLMEQAAHLDDFTMSIALGTVQDSLVMDDGFWNEVRTRWLDKIEECKTKLRAEVKAKHAQRRNGS